MSLTIDDFNMVDYVNPGKCRGSATLPDGGMVVLETYGHGIYNMEIKDLTDDDVNTILTLLERL